MKLINLREYLEARYKVLLVAVQKDYGLAKQAEINAIMAILGFSKALLTKLLVIKVLLLYPFNAIKKKERINGQAAVQEAPVEVVQETKA